MAIGTHADSRGGQRFARNLATGKRPLVFAFHFHFAGFALAAGVFNRSMAFFASSAWGP
jgi:hypothetical protein